MIHHYMNYLYVSMAPECNVSMFLSNNQEQSESYIITGENIPLEAGQNILEGMQMGGYNEFDESELAVQT